jgi:RecB family exonuclease
MPEKLWPVTPTKVLTWTDCPRRWRFTYLEHRPKGPPWAHNSVGAAVHQALRDWWSEPLERRTPETAASLVRRGWLTDGFPDDATSAQWCERSATMVARYVQGLDPTDEPAGVERTVATRTDTLTISGRVDRIDRRAAPPDDDASAPPDEMVVVDYKTGRRPLTDDDARSSVALALYALGTATVFRRPATLVELHHLPTGTTVSWRHTGESLARHVRRVESIARDARSAQAAWQQNGDGGVADPGAAAAVDELFPPQPSPGCSWCDHRRWCREGQQAAPTAAPWSGLAQDSGQGAGSR